MLEVLYGPFVDRLTRLQGNRNLPRQLSVLVYFSQHDNAK